MKGMKEMFRIYGTALFVAAALTFTAGVSKADTPVEEDSPSWSCVDDGNRICGPGNAQGAPAGCYDDGGVLIASWPCFVVETDDGDLEVYDYGVDNAHDNV